MKTVNHSMHNCIHGLLISWIDILFNMLCVTEVQELVKKFLSGEDLLQAVQPVLNQQLVQEFNTVYQFNITEPGQTKEYYLDLKNGKFVHQQPSSKTTPVFRIP